jgi:SAM-dependent methyltransferase
LAGVVAQRESGGIRENVGVFDRDVSSNGGYVYTINPACSSIVANQRLTDATVDAIPQGCRSLLDVGCGDGTYTKQIQDRFPGMAITGFDPSANAIERAAGLFPGICFTTGNILDRNTLPPGQFEFAVIRGVLHHVSDPALALKNVGLLANRILIIEPNGWNPVLKTIERLSKYHRDHEEQSFPLGRLKQWCEDAGLQVTSVDYVGFVPFFFPTTPAKLMHMLQPALERIPLVRHCLTACYVIVAERARQGR